MKNPQHFQSIFIQLENLAPTSLSYEVHTLPLDRLPALKDSARLVQGCYSLMISGQTVSPEAQWHQLDCEISLTDLASYLVPKHEDGVRIGSLGVNDGLPGEPGIKGVIQVKPAIMRDILDYFRFPLVLDERGQRRGNIVLRLDIGRGKLGGGGLAGDKYAIYRLALEDS